MTNKIIAFLIFILGIMFASIVQAEKYNFPNYSVMGPLENKGWEPVSVDKDMQQVIFRNQKKQALITILYEPCLDAEYFNNDAKAIADNKRDGEIAVMQNDPKTPVYKDTIKYGEEDIDGRKYYTLSYATATKPKTYGNLYFHISDDLKDMYIGHLSTYGKKTDDEEFNLFYTFKDVLKSIKRQDLTPYEDAMNRAQRLVAMFTAYAQQYDPKTNGEDFKKYLERGYGLSMHNITKALKLKPQSANAHFLLANLYEFNDEMIRYGENFPVKKAILEYYKVIKTDSKYENAFFNLGVIYFNAGNTDKAILNYKKVVGLNPTNNTASIYLYSAYEKEGLIKEAIEALQHTLDYWTGSKKDKEEIKNKVQELKKQV
ncbi:MAG: tetratricopeptide repeat protein [Nitrospirae bacterium]|nr:tetratricopeptide repeat protein [Nitrospirota bacterium]